MSYPEQVRTWILRALEAGPMSTSDLVLKTGARLRHVLAALRDMQQTDDVRRTTAGRYRRTDGRVTA